MVAVSTVAAIVMTIATAITTITVLMRVLLESLILFPDIGQEVFAQLFRSLDVFWIGAAISWSAWTT